MLTGVSGRFGGGIQTVLHFTDVYSPLNYTESHNPMMYVMYDTTGLYQVS